MSDLIRASGSLGYHVVTGNTERWTAWLSGGRSRERHSVLMAKLLRKPSGFQPMLDELFTATLDAARGSDIVISSAPGFCIGQPVAKRVGALHVSGFLQPFHATAGFPQMFWPELPETVRHGRAAYNRMTYRVTFAALRAMFGRGVAAARRRALGADSVGYRADPLVLYGFSSALVPRPPDWADPVHITGYWSEPEPAGWRPPAELAEFVAAGPPPVYVGLGSLAQIRPEIMDLAAAAVRRLGQRAVIATGWSGWRPREPDGRLYVTDAVPHSWLFPRVSAVVHHGGVGTIGAGLGAGCPTVTMPVMYDHFFFCRQVFNRGAGPRPLPFRRVTVAELSRAVLAATGDGRMRASARALAARIATEDGVSHAVELVEKYASR
jgi:UDP:flavonoid glycosyltransferase YjiC (YdhE family)